MIYKYIGRHQMNRRSYLCLYVYDNSKEFKIGIAGFSIYGTKSEKLRFYLGSSSQNFFSPPKLKMPPRALLLSKQGIKGLDFLISSEDSNSLFGMYSTGECKYSLMLSGNTVVRSLDLQLQLHIQSYVAMGGEGGKEWIRPIGHRQRC